MGNIQSLADCIENIYWQCNRLHFMGTFIWWTISFTSISWI